MTDAERIAAIEARLETETLVRPHYSTVLMKRDDIAWLLAELKRLTNDHVWLRAWIEWVTEVKDDDCRYDHHDCCQAHNLDERPCPVGEMKARLATNPEPPFIGDPFGVTRLATNPEATP